MSATSHDSSTKYALEAIPVGAPAPGEGVTVGEAGIWLDGDVLACACPECGAPMSIRLWLMVADCFRCGTSIELTEEQEQEALRLLREREAAKRADSARAVAAIAPTLVRKPRSKPAAKPAPKPAAKPTAKPTEAEPQIKRPAPEVPGRAAAVPAPAAQPRPHRRRVAASQVHRGARAKVHEIYEKGGLAVWWADTFNELPAWLVSLVVHLVAILLLGLWMDDPLRDNRAITLATSVSYQEMEGDQGEIEVVPVEAFEFDDPGAVELETVADDTGASDREDLVDLDSVDPVVEVPQPVGDVPDRAMREMIPVSTTRSGHMFQGRNPDVRAQIVRREGGTSYTEAAVARGLKWLARHQNADGSWSLHAFHKAPGAEGKGSGMGSSRSDMAATALALLPFLGAGQTHVEGEYSNVVFNGLRWIVEHQKENGDCRGSGGDGRMYAHGQAAIALCEAYALTGDEQLREPAQLAINFIVRAQHHQGGWRYEPGQPGDTSVVGWQLMALKSGQMAYLHVPNKTFELAGVFIDSVKRDEAGGRYGYQPRSTPTPAMTAEALLCRQYLGWPRSHAGLKDGVKFLLEKHPPDAGHPNIYYWYYATQVMHHYGGSAWEQWNAKMRQALVELQEKEGPAAGSWTPRGRGNSGGFADRGGRLYVTSLSTCILEVYYRHLPIYRKDVLERLE